MTHPWLTVRAVGADDAEAVARIKVAGWRETYASLVPPGVLEPMLDEARAAAHVRELLRAGGRGVLALRSGRVLGFATYDARDRSLDSFHVIASARGLGVGRELLRALAARIDGPPLHVHVVRGNDRTLALYERLGAVHAGEGPATWSPAVTEVRLRWDDLAPLG